MAAWADDLSKRGRGGVELDDDLNLDAVPAAWYRPKAPRAEHSADAEVPATRQAAGAHRKACDLRARESAGCATVGITAHAGGGRAHAFRLAWPLQTPRCHRVGDSTVGLLAHSR